MLPERDITQRDIVGTHIINSQYNQYKDKSNSDNYPHNFLCSMICIHIVLIALMSSAGVRSCCSPVSMFFSVSRPWAISVSPANAT